MAVETVKEHCKHEDCVYRGNIASVKSSVPCCDYLFLTGYTRNCKISKCDKYRKGKRKIMNDRGIGFRSVLEKEDELDI